MKHTNWKINVMEKKDYHALFRINQLETEGENAKVETWCLENVHIAPTLS